jgi:hypothetical protein
MIACRTPYVVLLAAALLLAWPLAAAEKPASNAALPGVDGSYRIVKPAPAPEPDDAAPTNSGKYGRWDVTISGTITTDITTGKLPLPRK